MPSELYKDGKYFLSKDQFSNDDLIRLWESLIKKYPIFSIEDPLHEDDWDGWVNLNNKIGDKIQIVGDDLFVTNLKNESLNYRIIEFYEGSIVIIYYFRIVLPA